MIVLEDLIKKTVLILGISLFLVGQVFAQTTPQFPLPPLPPLPEELTDGNVTDTTDTTTTTQTTTQTPTATTTTTTPTTSTTTPTQGEVEAATTEAKTGPATFPVVLFSIAAGLLALIISKGLTQRKSRG